MRTGKMGVSFTSEVQTPQGAEEIAFVQHGTNNGHNVIAWHGITSANSFWYWDQFWDVARVTLAGLPGHGPVRRYAPDHYARWTPQHLIDVGIATVRARNQGQPATLIGHSTGGMIALGVALQAPELVSRLILLNAVIWHDLRGIVRLWQTVSHSPLLGQMVVGATLGPTQQSYPIFRSALRMYISSPETLYSNPRFDETMQSGYPEYQATSIPAVAAVARVLSQVDLRPAIQEAPPTVPTLIIHGGLDGIVPLQQARWLDDHLPSSDLFVAPGTGHLTYAEREDLVFNCVDRWITNHPLH
jgi:pimeloyl-ACP methyl ester carboxylesterase